MSYILNYDKLHLSDIVLCGFPGDELSDQIRESTESSYSHVMLHIGGASLLHATFSGVFSENPQRMIFKNEGDVCILRLKESPPGETLKKISFFAQDKVLTPYDKRALVYFKDQTRMPTSRLTKKQICSRLIAQAYASAGINLVANPDFCTPEEIHSSCLLKKIEPALHLASNKELEFAKSSSQVMANFCETEHWVGKAKILAKSHDVVIDSINDVYDFIVANKDCDKDICNYIKETRYMIQYDDDREINKYRYNYGLFIQKIESLAEKERIESLIAHVYLWIHDYYRHLRMLIYYMYSADQALEYTQLHIELYTALTEINKERLNIVFETAIHYGYLPYIQDAASNVSAYEQSLLFTGINFV